MRSASEAETVGRRSDRRSDLVYGELAKTRPTRRWRWHSRRTRRSRRRRQRDSRFRHVDGPFDSHKPWGVDAIRTCKSYSNDFWSCPIISIEEDERDREVLRRRSTTRPCLSITARPLRVVKTLPTFSHDFEPRDHALMATAPPEMLDFRCEPSHPSAHLTHNLIIASSDRLDLHQICFHLYCFCT